MFPSHDRGGGGYTTGQVSTVDRLDYSSDTTTAAPKGPLSAVKQSHHSSAAGNANYGWWVGGYSGSSRVTTVDRVDYSNDTATASVRGPLTTETYEMSGQANSSFGYWAGGGIVGANVSTVQRVDFSNDTATPSSRGNLTVAATSLASISAKDYALGGTTSLPASSPINYGTNKSSYPYGYWGGGYPPGPIVTVSRIDYSNDTANASPKGALTGGRYNFAGMMNNSNFGS